ncbi:VOC family protein [Zhihengliuella somnathii]
MSIGLTPYLQFSGNAREALEFYQSAFGGELGMMTYAEAMGESAGGAGSQIMHGSLYVDRGIHLMASDLPEGMDSNGLGNISLSSSGDDAADAAALESWWANLQDGATVTVPLETAPWGDRFGQLIDKFGVSWMVNITATAG